MTRRTKRLRQSYYEVRYFGGNGPIGFDSEWLFPPPEGPADDEGTPCYPTKAAAVRAFREFVRAARADFPGTEDADPARYRIARITTEYLMPPGVPSGSR